MGEGTGPADWTSTDAWILAAIHGRSKRKRGNTLRHVIGAADAINHAIPTPDELASSIGALRAAGLVECDDDRIYLTREGERLTRHWKGGSFNWGPTLLPHLAALPRSIERFAVTHQEWQAAYDEYHPRSRRGS